MLSAINICNIRFDLNNIDDDLYTEIDFHFFIVYKIFNKI